MRVRSIAQAAVAFFLLAGAGLAIAQPAAAASPLTISATFDKPAYVSGDEVSVKFSVHNASSKPVIGVRAEQNSGTTELALQQPGFGVFENGATIPAGGTVTATLSGQLQSLTATKVTLAGNVFDHSGYGVDYSFSAPVTVRTATVTGLVFGDANGNGSADPGEALSGAHVVLSYRYGRTRYEATTGSDGRFSVVVPTASYYVTGSGSGSTVIPQTVNVGASGTDVTLRAVQPLGKQLTAALHFTQHTYTPGDTAHIVVTLTNTGSTPLRQIGAECDRVGDPWDLANNTPGWGALINTGTGVTILPHQVRTFDVTATVPAAARRAGEVIAACDFGYVGIDRGHRPEAEDTAKVPGLTGSLDGEVDYFPHGHGLANVRVVLIDPTTCPIFTKSATTNAKGYFRIADVPAGVSYKLYVYPPTGWKVVYDDPTGAEIFGNDTSHFGIEVEHGTAHVPPVPTSSPTCPASTPPGPPPVPIANTGTDASRLAALGGGSILVGLLLVVCGRRRRLVHAIG